jgi:hypothetical protein
MTVAYRTAALRFAKRLLAGMAASACLVLPLCAGSAAAGIAPEFAVKAAFLSKFGMFVEWPRPQTAPASGALVVCVLGTNPFGDILDRAVEGKRIVERPLTVRYLETVARNSRCDILYLGVSDRQSVTDALVAVNGSGILTVTDSALGGPGRGIIDFVVHNNRVRFTIDNQAAAASGITISSHLLNLAVAVRAPN